MNGFFQRARATAGRLSSEAGSNETDSTALAVAPRWVGPVFLLLTVALFPWIAYLALSLPSRTVANHYRTAWVGFDVLLVLAMAATAYLALTRRRGIEVPAIMTATLLVVDAWFDITTSRAGTAQLEAILLAVTVELPTALLAIYISRRVEHDLDLTLRHGADDHSALGHDKPGRQEKRLAQTLLSETGDEPGDEEAPCLQPN
jgi:hypothetical protein